MSAKKTAAAEPDQPAPETPAETPAQAAPEVVRVAFAGRIPMIVNPVGALEPGQILDVGPERAAALLDSPLFVAA